MIGKIHDSLYAYGDFTDWLLENGYQQFKAAYGCSMGGSIALRMAVDGRVKIGCAILDGAITPYQLPRALTRLILLRDFSMLAVGKPQLFAELLTWALSPGTGSVCI